MLDILAITGPIYLCILAGWASVRWNFSTKADMRVLGKFVLQIALPALLFSALASRPCCRRPCPCSGGHAILAQRRGHEGFATRPGW